MGIGPLFIVCLEMYEVCFIKTKTTHSLKHNNTNEIKVRNSLQ